MLYSVGASLPEYRIKVSIDLADSNNRIQEDEYARRYGFHAGLVPGMSVFAYMSRPLVDLFLTSPETGHCPWITELPPIRA